MDNDDIWAGLVDRFADKAFGARLVAYPLLMLVVPFLWWVVVKRRHPDRRPPYGAFTLVMLPFLLDVTGNSLDLFDAVVWWDDFSHFANWALLLTGIGLIICGPVRPPWAVVPLLAGLGAFPGIGEIRFVCFDAATADLYRNLLAEISKRRA